MLRLREETPGRWSGAKCLNFPPTEDCDAWFDKSEQEEAIDLCNGTWDGVQCPLRNQCLKFALTNNVKYGVWGGMSELSRAAMRRKMPTVKHKPNPEWRHMTEAEALDGFSPKEVENMRAELQYDD